MLPAFSVSLSHCQTPGGERGEREEEEGEGEGEKSGEEGVRRERRDGCMRVQ